MQGVPTYTVLWTYLGIPTGLLSDGGRQCEIRGQRCFASESSPTQMFCRQVWREAPARGLDAGTWRLTHHSHLVLLFWPLTRFILAPSCCALILQKCICGAFYGRTVQPNGAKRDRHAGLVSRFEPLNQPVSDSKLVLIFTNGKWKIVTDTSSAVGVQANQLK